VDGRASYGWGHEAIAPREGTARAERRARRRGEERKGEGREGRERGGGMMRGMRGMACPLSHAGLPLSHSALSPGHA